MVAVEENCGEYANFGIDCIEKVVDQLTYRSEVITKCIEYDVTNKTSNDYIMDVITSIELARYSGILGWPSVSINSIIYRGTMDGDDITEAICAYLKNPSKGCIEFMQNDITEYKIMEEEYPS